MYCPQCGSINDDSIAFCTKCGFNLEEHRRQWLEPSTAAQPPASDEQGGQGTGQEGTYTPQSAYPPPPAAAPSAYPPPYPQQYQPTHQAPPYQTPPPFQPGYYQPAGYDPYNRGVVPHVPSYMGWAVAVLVVSVLVGNLISIGTGIAAVVFASQVGNRLAIGDYAGAAYSSRRARLWSWISFAVLVAVIIILIIVLIALAATSVSTLNI